MGGDGKTYELTVTPAADLPVGRHEGSILVTATRPDGTLLPDQQVPVTLEVAPDVEAIPATVEFGCRDVGTEAAETVTLRSLSGRPFTVERVAAEGDGLTVDSSDRGHTIRRRVTGGPWEGRVRFTVRLSGGQVSQVIVPVRTHGFAGG
jgi:hypothetical protein